MPCFPRQLESDPDGLALTDLTSRRSWRQLEHNVSAFAAWLGREAGVQPGEHIALLIGNRVEYIEAMLAGVLAGLWVTPINTHLTPREIDYIRRDCGAKLVLHDRAHADLLAADGPGAALDVESLDLAAMPAAVIADTAPAGGNMLYTSGTTGKPKGVKRAKPDKVGEMLDRYRRLGTNFGLTGRGAHLVTGPLYHAAPGMFALYDMCNGAPVIIMPRWDSQVFFDCVREYRVATTHLVPTMFVRLLEARDAGAAGIDLASLRYVLHGAAPMPPVVKRRVLDWWGPLLTEYWGGTESGVVTMVDSAGWIGHPGTVGRPIPDFEVFVGDERGEPNGAGEGLLYCRHRSLPQVFSYHNDPEKTARAHPQPHVLSLGDIGRIDEEGFIYLSDRESNMIISGGVNIYPQEVEQALMEHPAVLDTAVLGLPDPEWGESVIAVVQLRPQYQGSAELAQALREFLRERIAGFKVPRRIEFVPELPRNAMGKVPLPELRARFARGAAAGRDFTPGARRR